MALLTKLPLGPLIWDDRGSWGIGHTKVRRAFPSWNRSILTEIYLCPACSCHERLRMETPGQGAAWAAPGPLATFFVSEPDSFDAPAGRDYYSLAAEFVPVAARPLARALQVGVCLSCPAHVES